MSVSSRCRFLLAPVLSLLFFGFGSTAAQGYNLSDVWGSGGSDVFAVGAGGTIFHFDGNCWTPEERDHAMLTGVWGSAERRLRRG